MAQSLWRWVLMAAVVVMPTAALSQDLRRCDQLAAHYDRYGGKVSEGKTAPGRLEREIGYEKCRKGDVGGGLSLLEDAIRKSGQTVPPP